MTQPRVSRLSRAARVAGPAAAVVLSILSLLAPPAAFAHRDPTIAVVLTGVTPSMPDGVGLELIDGDVSYVALSNNADEPVYALDPRRMPFLRVSADGVYGDLDSPYLGAAPQGVDPDATVDLDCCRDGQWVRLTTRSAWSWADPRLDPPLRAPVTGEDRGLGQLTSSEPLASWRFELRHDGTTYTAKGVLERRQPGEVTTTVEHEPDGISASIIESRPPQIRIEVAKGSEIEVLDDEGTSFIRTSPQGTYGRVTSPAYQAHLRAVGLSAAHGEVWQQVAGSGPTKATWADSRLDYKARIPDDPAGKGAVVINRWRIPVVVNGQRSMITGETTWKPATPPSLPSRGESAGFWATDGPAAYLVAGALTIAVLGAYALARVRRKEPR